MFDLVYNAATGRGMSCTTQCLDLELGESYATSKEKHQECKVLMTPLETTCKMSNTCSGFSESF